MFRLFTNLHRSVHSTVVKNCSFVIFKFALHDFFKMVAKAQWGKKMRTKAQKWFGEDLELATVRTKFTILWWLSGKTLRTWESKKIKILKFLRQSETCQTFITILFLFVVYHVHVLLLFFYTRFRYFQLRA